MGDGVLKSLSRQRLRWWRKDVHLRMNYSRHDSFAHQQTSLGLRENMLETFSIPVLAFIGNRVDMGRWTTNVRCAGVPRLARDAASQFIDRFLNTISHDCL